MSSVKPIASICVYCGSGFGDDPVFAENAAALGRSMAEQGISLVYGGGNVGLMGTVAKAVLDHGGYVTGIIPEFLKSRERLLHEVQETIVVPDMHTRKRLMFERADAFVALPGGIGTLEELVEQMTWSQLGQHTKPILMLSIKNFWKPLLTLIAHMREQGFIRPGLELNYLVAERVEEVIPMLENAARRIGIVENADLIETKF
ncbi:TIGR00730 family Rossman fold protein [Microvirga flocculans]|nr:TIGR00730 family Rossman fold protein [Microvirga flocculans]